LQQRSIYYRNKLNEKFLRHYQELLGYILCAFAKVDHHEEKVRLGLAEIVANEWRV
jgi:hypothetical protein